MARTNTSLNPFEIRAELLPIVARNMGDEDWVLIPLKSGLSYYASTLKGLAANPS